MEPSELDIDYSAARDTYRTRHEWNESTDLSTTVLLALQAMDEEVQTLGRPLYQDVDPDALNRLFAPTSADFPRDNGELSFRYDDDVLITIRATGEIFLSPTSPSHDPVGGMSHG